MMRYKELIFYKILDVGDTCQADIFVANNYVFSIPLHTSHEDVAEEVLAEIIGNKIKHLFPEHFIDKRQEVE